MQVSKYQRIHCLTDCSSHTANEGPADLSSAFAAIRVTANLWCLSNYIDMYHAVNKIGCQQLLDRNIKLGDMCGLNESLEQVHWLTLMHVYNARLYESCAKARNVDRYVARVLFCIFQSRVHQICVRNFNCNPLGPTGVAAVSGARTVLSGSRFLPYFTPQTYACRQKPSRNYHKHTDTLTHWHINMETQTHI